MSIKNWSVTPGSNTSAPPDGAPESSTKIKDFNDIIRQVMAKVRCLAAPVTIASAATTDLGASDETIQTISGTTTITAFGTVSSGIWKLVTFSGTLTLTHNATSLILLGGANRTTVAGDCGLYVSLGSGNWKEYFYSPIGGSQPLDATLTALAALNSTAGVIKQTGSDTFTKIPEGKVLQVVHYDTGAVATGTTGIPNDDTIPQNTEGDQYMSLAITPLSATSSLRIDVTGYFANSTAANVTVALFRDATASAIGVAGFYASLADDRATVTFSVKAPSTATTATTFKVRAGNNAGTLTFNGLSGARYMGGVMSSSIRITEIEA